MILKQAIRAAAFDSRVYKAIAESPEAVFRSLLVVAIAGLAFGLGMRTVAIEGRDESPTMLMLLRFATVITGWLLWATVVYLLGTLLLGGKARHRDLMRSMGMAYSPGLLLALVAIPAVGGTIVLITQALDACHRSDRRQRDPGIRDFPGDRAHRHRMGVGALAAAIDRLCPNLGLKRQCVTEHRRCAAPPRPSAAREAA